MEVLHKRRSNTFKNIVANQEQFLAIFDPHQINHVKAYELLLKGTTGVLRRAFSNRFRSTH